MASRLCWSFENGFRRVNMLASNKMFVADTMPSSMLPMFN
jgi:hypothetical protein